jgi:Flp pilus assembly pilin Flp
MGSSCDSRWPILALVSIVVVIMLTLVRSNVNKIYNTVAIRLGGAVPAA